MKIRVFTAFSGYDSQCMALDRLHEQYPEFEYELVGWAEIDKYAIAAHDAVYPQWAERNYGDISKIDWSQVPDFDLFTYSSPCQDFSNAGKQAGGEEGSGTRSSLLWECERAIVAKRPKYLLFENVAALVSAKFIRLFNQWQLRLESYGYKNFAKVLNAKDYGVPQNRERIFMVSILGENAKYEFPKPFKLDKYLINILERDVEDRYYLPQVTINTFEKHKLRNEEMGNGFGWQPTDGNTIANTVLASASNRPSSNYIIDSPNKRLSAAIENELQIERSGKVWLDCYKTKKGVTDIAPALTTRVDDANNDFIMEREPKMLKSVRTETAKELRRQGIENFQNRELVPREDGISNTLTGVQKDNLLAEPINEIIVSGHLNKGLSGNVYDTQGIAPTITASEAIKYNTKIIEPINSEDDGTSRTIKATCQQVSIANLKRRDSYGATGVIEINGECFRVRKLTERECFRVMDVPEEYIDRIQKSGVSKTQQYKMAGNSIVVSNMYHIFRTLFVDTQITELTLF